MSLISFLIIAVAIFFAVCLGSQRPVCSTGAYPVLQFSDVGRESKFSSWWICVKAEIK